VLSDQNNWQWLLYRWQSMCKSRFKYGNYIDTKIILNYHLLSYYMQHKGYIDSTEIFSTSNTIIETCKTIRYKYIFCCFMIVLIKYQGSQMKTACVPWRRRIQQTQRPVWYNWSASLSTANITLWLACLSTKY